ncbi:Alpha/Beta hydrolase protein [Ephemerocybe angulata]|uniref:Alpha/Beta hydrolase protein n=1 Tax=Ephemerocybe angulata TaxID=980116 RepID=A0A8H6HWF0_9AGAR|nr:Alpha/Beta hydrolase protein [Tulosesus angulatus]
MKSLFTGILVLLSASVNVALSQGTSDLASNAAPVDVQAPLLPFYRDVKTSRGYKYHYYFSAAAAGKPTLLLVHGFPSLSVDWYRQIAYFKKKGYGLVVPDGLGYGGTDKPEEAKVYVHSLLAKDLVDILDHEKVANVLAIGHDWGATTASSLANLHADRFLGFGFLAVGYQAPNTNLTYEQILESNAKLLGYENFGYWKFFSSPDADRIIRGHLQSFWDVIWAKHPSIWRFSFSPTGAFQSFLESDSRTPRASYFKELEPIYNKVFGQNGFKAAVNFYTIQTNGDDQEDDKNVPLENYTIKKPVFFGAATQDLIAVSSIQIAVTKQFCLNSTIQEFNASHWVHHELPDEVNTALDKWIRTVVA